MAFSSSYVHLPRLAIVHSCRQQQTLKIPAPLLSSPTYAHATLPSSLMIRASCSLPNLLPIPQKYKLQFLSPRTPQHPNLFASSSTTRSGSTMCTAAALCENTSSEITSKVPVTEICILVFVYIIPFIKRLNLLSTFPVLRYAMNPILALLGFYQSIPTLGLIAFLAFFIGFVRYRNFNKLQSLQATVMDCLVVIASLLRPYLVNPGPLAGGALGFKFQLLNALELLTFQACIHSCLKYLESVSWVLWRPSKIDALAHIIKVVLKTNADEGRREGKFSVLKLLRADDSLLSDGNSAKACNRIILSLCRSCLNSLPKLFKIAENCDLMFYYSHTDELISLQADNILWLVDILADRKAAEEFALMWANQQNLANLHTKTNTPSRHLISCITARLIVGIENGEILLAKDTRRLLLQTWFLPLVDDYSDLRKLRSFDAKVVEENIERAILELTPENQQSMLLAWYERFLKNGDNCPDLRTAYQDWCKRTFI